MSHSNTADSVVAGAISSLGLGKLFGLISYDDLFSAIILGAAGAFGGWLIKNLLGYIKHKIINYKTNKSKKTTNNEKI